MTFGETVVNVATIIASTSSVNITPYTVPTGRYSIINIKSANVSAADGDIQIGGAEITVPVTPNDNMVVYLRSGQTIVLTRGSGGTASINATAIEFNLP
jgi:hypothetical protein